MLKLAGKRPGYTGQSQAGSRAGVAAGYELRHLFTSDEPDPAAPEDKAEVTPRIPIAGAIPQLTFCLGYAEPKKGYTLRRPLNEVLI